MIHNKRATTIKNQSQAVPTNRRFKRYKIFDSTERHLVETQLHLYNKMKGKNSTVGIVLISIRNIVWTAHFMTTVLPVLFKYCYKYCYSDSRKLWAVMKGGGLEL